LVLKRREAFIPDAADVGTLLLRWPGRHLRDPAAGYFYFRSAGDAQTRLDRAVVFRRRRQLAPLFRRPNWRRATGAARLPEWPWGILAGANLAAASSPMPACSIPGILAHGRSVWRSCAAGAVRS